MRIDKSEKKCNTIRSSLSVEDEVVNSRLYGSFTQNLELARGFDQTSAPSLEPMIVQHKHQVVPKRGSK